MNIFERLWMFLGDSAYDLFHLNDKYGQENLRGWLETRKHEWHNFVW